MAKVSQIPRNYFLTFAQLGYGPRLLPIIPPGSIIAPGSKVNPKAVGKLPGIRRDDGWTGFGGWQSHEATTEEHEAWRAWEASMGVRTGDGLLALDIDCTDEMTARQIRQKVFDHLGDLGFPERVGRHPKTLFLMRLEGKLTHLHLGFGDLNEKGNHEQGIDLLYGGKQFVAHGTHPITGNPYSWPVPIMPFDKLPVVQAAQVDALIAELAMILPGVDKPDLAPSGKAVTGLQASDPAMVKRALDAMTNTSATFGNRRQWLNLAYMLKGALPDDPGFALELYQEFGARWIEGDNDPEYNEIEFNKCKPPYRLGAAALYDLAAKQSGFNPWFEEYDDDAPEVSDPADGWRMYTFAQLADPEMHLAAEPLIEGLLSQGALSAFYGPPGQGKTYVMLDMALCVALGKPWGGLEAEQGAVAYVVLEGFGGMPARAQALIHKHGAAALGAPLHVLNGALYLGERASSEKLGRQLRKIPNLRWLIVDTLANAMGGLDENSAKDMGQVMAAAQAVARAFKCHLSFVHHMGKNEAAGLRGSTALSGKLDTVVEINRGLIIPEKQRDLEVLRPIGFRLTGHTVGTDAKGRPIKAASVSYDAAGRSEGDRLAKVLAGVEGDVIDALRALQADLKHGARVVDVYQWIIANRNAGTLDRNVRNAVARLLKARFIELVSPAHYRAIITPNDYDQRERKSGGVFD